jgi:hypothetical protein
MYHAIVRRRVAALFAAVSNGDARPVLEGLAPRFEHFFLGDHALGGSRFTLEKTKLWYERLYRLLQDISFDLRAIRISGAPWNSALARAQSAEAMIASPSIPKKAFGIVAVVARAVMSSHWFSISTTWTLLPPVRR